MLRVALVGLGDAGGHHARALARTNVVAWSAICARSAESIGRFATEHAVPDSVEHVVGFERLLASRTCDIVVLATPDSLHADQIVACAEAGVSVLAEKPLALSTADAQRAIDACQHHRVALGIGYHLRHHAGHRMLRRELSKHIGTLRRISVRWAWPDPARTGWRARGAMASTWSLAALGTHGIDLAMWLARCNEVERHVALFDPPDGIDEASELSFRLSNGTLVHVSSSVTQRAPSVLRITGDEGEITCERTLGARGGGRIVVTRGKSDPEPITFTPMHPYTAQLEHFAARVESGDDDESVDAALANVRLIEDARRTT